METPAIQLTADIYKFRLDNDHQDEKQQ